MKTAVVYYSKHHNNTKKVLDAIAENGDITLIDATSPLKTDLSDYDLIGFASGIYWSDFHKSVISFAENNLPKSKKVFFVYTCGAKKDSYTKNIRKTAEAKDCDIVGEYGCTGYDTFGPFKLIGGMAKGHPDAKDLEDAKNFYSKLSE